MRVDGGTVFWVWGVWRGWILWGSSGEVSCLAGEGLWLSPNIFVGRSCVGCSGISLSGANGIGPVVFWVVRLTARVARLATQGARGGWTAFRSERSFQGCIFVT